MSEKNENQTTAELAAQAVEPQKLDEGEVYAIANGEGEVKVIDTDQYAETPRRAKASRLVNDAASFNAYVNKHDEGDAEVWADTRNATVIAVVNAHNLGVPGWEDHKVQLKLEKTPAWLAWEAVDGKFFDQLFFAEFIDARAVDVQDPAPLDLIELAQHFQAHRKVEFKSSQSLASGQTQLEYVETLSANNSKKDSVAIPDSILLAIKPYIGGPIYHVNARFRYRLNEGALTLGVALERPQEVLDAAFADIVDVIRNGKAETLATHATADAPATDPRSAIEAVRADIYYGRPAAS